MGQYQPNFFYCTQNTFIFHYLILRKFATRHFWVYGIHFFFNEVSCIFSMWKLSSSSLGQISQIQTGWKQHISVKRDLKLFKWRTMLFSNGNSYVRYVFPNNWPDCMNSREIWPLTPPNYKLLDHYFEQISLGGSN